MSPLSRDAGESVSNMLNTIAQSVGATIEPGMTAMEAVMSHRSMDWTPEFRPMRYLGTCDTTGEKKWLESTKGTRTVVRSDSGEPIGEVGSSYVAIPNRDAFGIADKIKGSTIVACGEFEGGATAYMQLKLDEQSNTVKLLSGIEDVIDQYLLICTGHTANRNRTILFTPTRVWCKNTLNSALKGKKDETSGYIRHSGDTSAKVDISDQLLVKAGVFFKDMTASFQRLANAQVREPVVKQYFMDVEGVDRGNEAHIETVNGVLTDVLKGRKRNMFDRYMSAYNASSHGADRDGVRGTLWGAYNAVTKVQDHDVVEEKRSLPTKDKDTGKVIKSGNDRAAHQLFTAGVRMKTLALTEALKIEATLN